MWSLIMTAMIAASTTQLSEHDFTSLNIESHHLIDPGKALGVTDVLEAYLRGEIPSASTMSLGFDSGAHWFVIKLLNPHPTTAWIFELEYPLLDEVDIYVVREGGEVEHSTIGDRYPFSDRYFPSRFLHLPLGLDPGETVTIVWRVSTQTSIIAGARIAPHDLWLPSRAKESQLKLIVYGVMLTVMFSQIILGLWTGDRTASFVGTAAGAALVAMVSLDGMGAQLFDLFPVELRKSSVLISVLVLATFLTLTFKELFQLSQKSLWRSRFTNLMICLNAVVIFLILIFGYELAQFTALLAFLSTLTLIEALIWANRQRMRAAYVADAACIFIIVPPFLNSQRFAGFLENSPFLDNANAIGFGLGFIAFSLATADKMLLERRERRALLLEVENSQNALEKIEKTKVELEAQNISLADEMRVASQKLTGADQMATLGIMMSGVIHDMNNPLQFISGLDQTYETHHRELEALLDELLGEADGPEAQELRAVIHAHFHALGQSTHDLKLGTSKLKALSTAMRNSARRDPQPAHHPLRSIVDESITILGSKLKLHTLSCDIPENLMVYVMRSQLSQILINLISNARDATQEKYDQQHLVDYHPWIQISAIETEMNGSQGTLICVEDNGDGISELNQSKVFETFYTTKPVGVGTGLGLSIIQRLVSNHHGKLELGISALGGAKFDLFFPLPKEEINAIHMDENPPDTEASKIA